MKIAYVVDNWLGMSGNGIVSQALTWKTLLESKSVDIVLVSPWDKINWYDIDIAHLFGSSEIWFYNAAKTLKSKGVKVIWSPICDNIDNPIFQRLKTYVGCPNVGMFSLPYIRKKAYSIVDAIFVRSNYEYDYIVKSYNVDKNKIEIIPLAMSYDEVCSINYDEKESFCFHLSHISQPRKNVVRLVKAAKKFGFELVLAGNKGTIADYDIIKHAIDNAPNIKVLGFISEGEKISLYKRAKVFALPSINEGVGIVALDAAHFGCEVVITNIGGPKEYYEGKAFLVNPYDIDAIGCAVTSALEGKYQPVLKQHVDNLYSKHSIADKLQKAYFKIADI